MLIGSQAPEWAPVSAPEWAPECTPVCTMDGYYYRAAPDSTGGLHQIVKCVHQRCRRILSWPRLGITCMPGLAMLIPTRLDLDQKWYFQAVFWIFFVGQCLGLRRSPNSKIHFSLFLYIGMTLKFPWGFNIHIWFPPYYYYYYHYYLKCPALLLK